MFRLTVGRRLGLVVAVALAAVLVIVFVILRLIAADSVERTVDDLDALSTPIAQSIEIEIEAAARLLEFEADNFASESETLTTRRIRNAGFATVDYAHASTGDSRIDVSTNFLQRAAVATSIGATQVFEGRVGVVIGTPLPDGGELGDVMIGVYDATPILSVVESARAGKSTEVLLAARNSDEAIAVFSASRHNDDQPIGRPDAETAAALGAVLESPVQQQFEDTTLNGRNVVAVLTPVEVTRWVVFATTDRADSGASTIPWWLLPLLLGVIGLLALLPILALRSRIGEVVTGAQQLARGRLTQELSDPTDDEIGFLSRTLQSLDDRLQVDSEQRGRSAAMLQHRASHDPLTGLANRTRLMEELTVALNNRESVGVLFCDIDDFKGINDLQGHEGGDLVLKFVANQLASVCGDTELIARFGGDEFCVLSRSSPQDARQLSTQVERALDATCIVNGSQQRVGGSVGMAIAKVTDTPDSVLKSADLAMYREKERRRGLRRAKTRAADPSVSPEQIRLNFQPVVRIAEEQIVGVEVLARYMHPELGMLDPSSFMPEGIELGLFDTFDLEILTRSMAQLSLWLTQGAIDERFTMSVNLSPDHVSDSDSTRKIFDIIRENRIPPGMLQIEVTEHKLHAHADDLISSLTALRERGIKVAIDDFGVEGSNVDRLLQFPSDVVKIDRSFISEIDTEDRAENRLRAILEIVANEGRVPIAEGVERAGQARVLRNLGVELGQGYLWHAPITAIALSPLLGRASRWSRKKRAAAE